MWQSWQIEMLLEADRINVPMWAIAQEFGVPLEKVYIKLAELWRGAA